MRLMTLKILGWIILLLVLSPALAFAHNPMTSWAIAHIYADRLELDVELSSESAWLLVGKPATSPPDVASELPQLKALAPSLYNISISGVELVPSKSEVELREEDAVGFRVVYPGKFDGPLRFHAAYLQRLSADHRTTLTLKDDSDKVLRTELLTSTNSVAEMGLTSDSQARAGLQSTVSFRAFLKLGVEHILTGYDHLLFLCGLLVVCRRFSSMAAIITCFTVAHSITLALAALNLVAIPGTIVEPLIAASIVVVGLENLLRRDEPKWRWALTFAFGLIHGFGFAGVLKQVGLGSEGKALLVPLFSFNFGVELGQIAVAAIVLPLLWWLRRYAAFERYGTRIISTAVLLIGLFWLVQRVFFV